MRTPVASLLGIRARCELLGLLRSTGIPTLEVPHDLVTSPAAATTSSSSTRAQ